MKITKLLLFLFFISPLNFIFAQSSVEGYTTHEIHGFSVFMHDEAVSSEPEKMQAALDELTNQLSNISNLDMRPADMAALRDVKIFVDWATTDGGAQYHPSEQWLIDNGYNPNKALSVEISNAVNFVSWCKQNQPWMVLHELTHAYHHQVFSFSNQTLTDAYESARKSGIYNSVDYNPGNGQNTFKQRAYALNNDREYFSEITEAYFGENDYYPFNRSQLESHDSLGYAALIEIWGEENLTSVTNSNKIPNEFRLYQNYPNPFNPETRIEYSLPQESKIVLTIYNILGKEVSVLENSYKSAGNYSIAFNASNLPSGLYFYSIRANNFVETKKMLLLK